MTDLENIKKRLKSNPMYALSLGSRELFHSNFLAWIVENYPPVIATLFETAVPNAKAQRERSNLDLIIASDEEIPGQVIVVEVKVKDAPKVDQLEHYDKTIQKLFPESAVQKVLVSLVEPPKLINGLSSWHYMSFSNLGQKILNFMSNNTIDYGHSIIIQDYAHLCHDLHALVTKITEADRQSRDYFFVKPGQKAAISSTDEVAEDLGFGDTLQKHRASALCEEIKRKAEKIDFKRFKPKFDYGFDQKMSHAGGALTLELQDARKSKIHLGIHIQGEQYRRSLSFDGYQVPRRKDKDPESLKFFIDETDGWRWMFGIEHYDRIFHKPNEQGGFFEKKNKIPTSQQANKLLCSYAPAHIYQYTNIGDEAGVQISEVVDAVIADLQYAAQLLTDPSYLARFEKWLLRS